MLGLPKPELDSATRWFSKQSAFEYVTLHFPDVVVFINNYSKDDPEALATITRMKEMSNPNNKSCGTLKLELSMVCSYNDCLMRSCYNLEGDSPNLITLAYDCWNGIGFMLEPQAGMNQMSF